MSLTLNIGLPVLSSLLPVPFIWGPVGGGESAPKSFWKDFSLRGRVYETLRNVAQSIGERDPFTAMTAWHSKLALATTPETLERLQWLKTPKHEIFSQIGLSKPEIEYFSQCSQPVKREPVCFLSIGRLLHWKGTYLGIRAFAAARLENSEYWIIGEGIEKARLQRLAQELGVTDSVKFLGKISRNQLVEAVSHCHVLVHPSLHDSGGQVCAEMMAAGRPVICLDLGGPAVQVTEQTGIKISAHNPEQVTQDIAEAISRLADSPKLREDMGKAGQQRIKEAFDWNVKGNLIDQFYKQVVSEPSN